jgi:predicted RNase H-like HicB family nuclease
MTDHVYTVTVPSLPGVVAQANSAESVIELAKDTIALHLEGMITDGETIPDETLRPQTITLEIVVPEIATVRR